MLNPQTILQQTIRRLLPPHRTLTTLPANSQTYLKQITTLAYNPCRTRTDTQQLQHLFDQFLTHVPQSRRPWAKIHNVIRSLAYYGHPQLKTMFLRSLAFEGVDCWSEAIKGCLRSGQVEDADELLMAGHGRDLKFDPTIYSRLISYWLRRGDQKSASRVFAMMIHHKIQPTREIYANFIRFYITNHPESFETLEKLWQAVLMTSHDPVPHSIVCSLLSYFRSVGRLGTAEQIVIDLRQRQHRFDRACLGEIHRLILKFAYRKQLLSALSLMYDLLGAGYKPSSYVVRTLAKISIDRHDLESIKTLLNVIESHYPNHNLSQDCYDLLQHASDQNKKKLNSF